MTRLSPLAHPADRGAYPRPQIYRESWLSLDGPWEFTFDDDRRGHVEHWEQDPRPFARTIVVPFPPESPASGIGDTTPRATAWYRRTLPSAELPARRRPDDRHVLHLGAVDHLADVWVDGQHVTTHVGGQTPVVVDVTDALDPHATEHVIVVRAEDDPENVEQPRGKQDWLPEPHVIWYHRTTGIWQSVWIETVPRDHVEHLTWRSDVPGARIEVAVRLGARPTTARTCRVQIEHAGKTLATAEVDVHNDLAEVTLSLPRQRNGQAYETLLWSPDAPVLLDARVALLDEAGDEIDQVLSYVGMRSVQVDRGQLLLNDRPFYTRAVLAQGYWPESHLAAPSPDALRAEVALIKELGFNTVRVHQKVEDPRFLYWCDTLGVAVWAETAAALQFSDVAVQHLTREWLDIVRRDISHPSVLAWVPFNESWGIQHVAHDTAQQQYSRALTSLTRALDPTRPVISNDGWEHTDSDLCTVHDYEADPVVIAARYGSPETVEGWMRGIGPAGRRMWLGPHPPAVGEMPILLSEFGGVSFDTAQLDDAWGYSTAQDAPGFEAAVGGLLEAVHRSPVLQGFCYTQLTDTRQETNGICDDTRRPKLPIDVVRAMVIGTH
ncbi:glycoside hydrolase family 2 protein [Cellulomonas timonensis]|uniref:glycoside hydrolase family 2 protein n=1 Tax=Cellulomonas timonensis TaxID=1689271 RepID=UPI0008368650|nr:glycoside hydrolase family 2 [Cellulomonas timonensis]